jgi:putative membrane protein
MSAGVHCDSGSWSLLVLIASLLIMIAYWRRWYRVRREFPSAAPRWRLAAFVTGVLLLLVVTGSPLAALDHQLLTAHMAQHLLLMTVAAPLILLGAPGIAVCAFQRRPLLRAIGGLITHPVCCWLASTMTVIGWHVPALFAIGMRSEAWHAAEQASFFAAGLLFWLPVIRPWPSVAAWHQWSVPLYLFLATLPCDALSAFLTFCNHVAYPGYLAGPRLLDISALADQQCAGALMWVWVTFAYLAPAATVTIRMLSPRGRLWPAEAA